MDRLARKEPTMSLHYCEFCGDGPTCNVCGRGTGKKLIAVLAEYADPASDPRVVSYDKPRRNVREHQVCGGGRRILKKRIGGN